MHVRLSMDRWVWLSTTCAYGISHNACVCSLTMAGVEHQLGLGLYHGEHRGGALTEQHALHPQWVAVRVGGRGKWWESGVMKQVKRDQTRKIWSRSQGDLGRGQWARGAAGTGSWVSGQWGSPRVPSSEQGGLNRPAHCSSRPTPGAWLQPLPLAWRGKDPPGNT